MENCNNKLTEEEIKELNKYTADMYHRVMVKIAFDNYENVEDIQNVAKDAIQNFSSHTLEICNKHEIK